MYIARNQGHVAQMMSYIVQNFIVLYDILLHIYHACFVSWRLRDIDLYITHFWHFFHLIEVKEQDEFYLIIHIYGTCFISSWFKERDTLHSMVYSTIFYSTLF